MRKEKKRCNIYRIYFLVATLVKYFEELTTNHEIDETIAQLSYWKRSNKSKWKKVRPQVALFTFISYISDVFLRQGRIAIREYYLEVSRRLRKAKEKNKTISKSCCFYHIHGAKFPAIFFITSRATMKKT